MSRALPLVAAAAALLAPLSAAATASAATPCVPAHSTTLASTPGARVFALGGKAFVCQRATGRTHRLAGASPTRDVFALGGAWVGWSSGARHSVVHVARVADLSHTGDFPFDTNDRVRRIVVKASGAAAWAAAPSDGSGIYVQGMDRRHHPADLLSDDQRSVIPASLVSKPGHRIEWRYRTGPAGSANLY